MAASCAENSVVEVFGSGLDDMCSSSVDSSSTCTTKTSHSSSTSILQTNADASRARGAVLSCGSNGKNRMEEDAIKRCTRSSSLKTAMMRSLKTSSKVHNNDIKSNLTSSSSDGADSRSFDVRNSLQYVAQNGASTDKPKDLIVCRWFECSKEVNFGELLDHLNDEHIRTQLKKKPGKDKPTYVCKWTGCKVYGKPSTLHSWLEKHVLCHLGSKPFHCIVDHCGMRFSSQYMLNRHINGHFPKQKSIRCKKEMTTNLNYLKVSDMRKKPKHPRPAQVVTRDFCDPFTMSCIQRYITNFCQRTQMASNNSGQFITFHGVVIGKRTDFNGIKSCLIRWLPLHILPDEWLPEHQVPSKLTQVLPLSRMSGDVIRFLMRDV